MSEMDAVYSPKSYEKKIWDMWMAQKIFNAKVDPDRKPYTILMPPPNVTSKLHMGHGTGYTIQDLLIRWKRMCGYNACWLPGTDHAGIATQMMVEKELLESEGKTKDQLGREKFVERLHQWKEKYGGIILDQFANLGFSCDWDRVAYTMDPKLSEAVRHVFVQLFQEGLIYRGERLVNWDTQLKTAISDDEVESVEINGHLWQFRYPIDGTDAFIPIATTRPETMLGDTAVAVHPDDERYQAWIGKMVRLPFSGRLIPIVADPYVKSEFGTGAVKITPAHDPNDFEIGKRHSLPFITILNDDGTLNDKVPERFQGMDRFVARKEVIKGLKELGLFDEEKSYRHAVPHSERSKTIIEPKLSMQWYVRMADLAKPAADAARNGDLQFYPETWRKTYLYWLDNIQDWCISRQLWWGHRIPIWYCQDCEGVSTGMDDPTHCTHCQSSRIQQDPDVLDTWFSSWLWPLSPFGWPEESKGQTRDLDYFYPSDVLVTAPEIIFLWVARMVMVGLKFKGKVPFRDVYFNATVCDKKGRKFSKTLGNGIDPLDVIDKHGADAVRYTAVSLAPLGGRVRMDESDFDAGARFINKIWNASRFLMRYVEPGFKPKPLNQCTLTLPEQWLVENLRQTAVKAQSLFESYRINEAVESVYHYIWGSFCDWGLECSKDTLNGPAGPEKDAALSVLIYALEGALRLAHPVIPFITEEIWQKLPHHPDWVRASALAVSAYPSAANMPAYEQAASDWEKIQDLITGIRSTRQQAGISPKVGMSAFVMTSAAATVSLVQKSEPWIKRLAGIDTLQAGTSLQKPGRSLTFVGRDFQIYLPAEGLMDIDKEKARLQQEMVRIEKLLAGIHAKLSNQDFVARAPEDILETTRAQQTNLATQLASLKANVDSLV